ncbi:MAG: endonuclease/exonuclease/phosphatase family protein, partial [Clostridia bacterium]|nr:endonuclease/exonuclease/phosphatase family protein [Clostridia bacterium]
TDITESKHIIACSAEGCTESYTEDCTIVSEIHPKTCTDDGTIEYSCAVCGYHQVVVTSLATGHTWKNAVHLQGTQASASKHIIACSVEGCTESYTEACALTKTSVGPGIIRYHCSACGYQETMPDQSGTPVRIMTQNLRFNSAANQGTDNDAQLRQYRFQALVENYDPDIIAAQEFDAFWENALPSLLGDEYSIYYKYRESPKGSNEASAILWKTAKYDLLDQGYFWLSENPNSASPAGFGQYHPRITNWVKLRDKTTGDKIVVYSTHLGSSYTLENIQYIRGLFTERIQDHPDATCFVMGDFNFSYDEDLYPAMADGSNLVDLRLIAAQMNQNDHCTLGELRTGTYNGFKKPDGSNWIDFIFAPPNDNVAIDFYGVCYDQIAVPSQNIAEGYVSDHFAVLTDVRINTDISYGQYWSPES